MVTVSDVIVKFRLFFSFYILLMEIILAIKSISLTHFFNFILVKAAQMNDPQVNQAIEQTEAELKKRELDLQGKHQEVLSHGKATLELKQDLARQQVKAHLQSADLEEFKQQYEKAKEDATKLLAEKEAEYKQQMEELIEIGQGSAKPT